MLWRIMRTYLWCNSCKFSCSTTPSSDKPWASNLQRAIEAVSACNAFAVDERVELSRVAAVAKCCCSSEMHCASHSVVARLRALSKSANQFTDRPNSSTTHPCQICGLKEQSQLAQLQRQQPMRRSASAEVCDEQKQTETVVLLWRGGTTVRHCNEECSGCC